MSKPEAVCQHNFVKAGRAHYCDYIHVPGLLETFYPGATTVDEVLLCSGLYAYVLWWNLQAQELTALLELSQAGQPLDQASCYDAIKRASRCVELSRIMLQQGVILRSELLRRKPKVQFRFSDGDPGQIALYTEVGHLSRQLEQRLNSFRLVDGLDPNVAERLLDSLKDLLLNQADSFETIQRDYRDLVWAMHEQPAARVVELAEVVPVAALLSYSQSSLEKQHPQAAQPGHSNDELTFITVHQVFEVWFPAVINSVQEATRLLEARPAHTWEAEALARRIADIFSLFGRMIHVPQTMTAADYIEFRGQLEAGSGVESYQFRAIEISAGLRDKTYHQTIEYMRLLTPDLKLLWDAPSLNSAFMQLLQDRHLLDTADAPGEIARKLAAILLPTGQESDFVDIAALAESLVRFEQNVELWRTDHIAMVTRMIGRKSGTGAETYGQLSSPGDQTRYDSLPYLYRTLKYQKVFPALWDARDYLQEQQTDS